MSMHPLRQTLIIALLFAGGSSPALRADVALPALLSKHAVVQRSSATHFWGRASAGEKVTVTLGDLSGSTTTNDDGRWKLDLDLRKAPEGPFDLVVQGNNQIVVPDVIVGEVWLCSGQSNIAFKLDRAAEGAQEIPQSANARLRQFRVGNNPQATPADEAKGGWIVASPETSAEFSAVGYFFAKSVQQQMNAPVGIILSAWAGTAALCWMPTSVIEKDPEWTARRAAVVKNLDEYDARKVAYLPAYRAWEKQYGREDNPLDNKPFTAPDLTAPEWRLVSLPTKLKPAGLPDSGVVWFSRRFTMPAANFTNAYFNVGSVRDFHEAFLNGVSIGRTNLESMKGGFDVRYPLSPGALKVGENVLSLRVSTPSENGALGSAMYVAAGTARVLLTGDWSARVEKALPPLTPEARQALPPTPPNPGSQSVPGRLYNGMIHPFSSASIQGVVWYQGEQDTGQPANYWRILEGLINGWRADWGRELPFYVCQLPNNSVKKDQPESSLWAQLREAQGKALTLPSTGVAVTIDLGEEDVHPLNKKEVGERLAKLALARTYGQKIVDAGPIFESMKIEGDKAEITFHSSDAALVARPLPADYQPTNMSPKRVPLVRHSPGGELEGFAVCGENKKWVWANAVIVGNKVIVSSPEAPQPIAVRYAWANNPTVNLYNTAGLPAAPFRTDQ